MMTAAAILQSQDEWSRILTNPRVLVAAILTGAAAAWQVTLSIRGRRKEQSRWITTALARSDPKRVGPYRVLGRLGSGAMGVVYLGVARDGTLVAVKVVRPEFADNAEFRKRFAREVAAVRNVHGRYTAPLLAADTDANQPWLATAYVPGGSLQQDIDEHGPYTEDRLWRLAAGLAEALQNIHRAGLVHRDLKPTNILLSSDGPRVIDFGIARAADASHLTSTSVRVGTPSYMAPEQVTGQEVGPPTDVFALGLVLAFAATGRPPYGEGPAEALRARVVTGEPDLSGLTGAFRSLVHECISKDPRSRPTPEQIVERCLAHVGPESPATTEAVAVVTPPIRHRLAMIAGLAVLTVAIVSAAMQFLPDRPTAGTEPTPSAPGIGAPTMSRGSVVGSPPAASTPEPSGQDTSPAPNSTGTSSAPSQASNPLPNASPPAPPGNLAAAPVAAGTIRLTWTDNSSNETGFTITNDSGTTRQVGANTVSYDWEGLSAGSHVCFRVRADNAAGSSSYHPASSSVCATTSLQPMAPSNVSVTANGGTVVIRWTDNATNEAGYEVDSGTEGKGASFSYFYADGHPNPLTSVTQDMGTDGWRCFRVRAFANVGGDLLYSDYSPAGSFACPGGRAPTAPAAPSNVTITAAGSGTLRVAWTDNSDNEDYWLVTYRVGGGQPQTEFARAFDYVDITATPGSNLCVDSVAAYNPVGSASVSGPAACTTFPPM